MSQTFKIPSRVVIKGKVWSVDYKWRLVNDKGEECNGLVEWVEKCIYLDRAASREDKCQALLHEIIHIILDEYNLHEEGGIGSTFAEESICAGVARTLLETFKLTFRAETHNAVSRRTNTRS